MMARNNLAYIPAFKGFYNPPLGRFLPSIPRGVIAQWLESNTRPGDLILDPLGANPMTAVEIARASRRVLFARNNPIIWLLLEAIASAPTEKQLKVLVSKLLLSRQMGESLDSFLQSIYATICSECGNRIQPQGFIWEQNSNLPTSKVYSCPHCGDEGERPVSEYDIHNLERLGKIGLHRTRAFQRVMQGGEYEKESIESALDCYLPRAIYVTMLLANRLETLVLEKDERKLLQAILVSVFDDGTSLWHWPRKDNRPLQLTLPPRFIEKNLWLSLDNAPKIWKSEEAQIPVSYWPKLPPIEGGICFYQRRLADQKGLLQDESPAALVSVFPRPNQAFWTLSALWSGWLWGSKAVTPMRSALSRRRYDWYWFAQAINASCKALTASFTSSTPFFGLFPQITANFYLGLQVGLCTAGFTAMGAAYRMADDLIEGQWQFKPNKTSLDNLNLKSLISDFLSSRGEPANFQEIILHCITEIAISGNLSMLLSGMDDSFFRQIQEGITSALRDEQFAQSYKSNLPGGSQWWLCDSVSAQPPLSERVEKFIRDELLKGEDIDNRSMENLVCRHFLNCNTPSAELIRLCLESYADPTSRDTHRYLIQPEENQIVRNADINEIRSILSICAKKMGLIQEGKDEWIKWKTDDGKLSYRYYLTTTSANAEIIIDSSTNEGVYNVVVFPGSRSRLMAYRLIHDPRLEDAAEQNWYFMKFRTLRRLLHQENLTIELWNELLKSDPPLWDPPIQFQLF